jgi:hypothetical protein
MTEKTSSAILTTRYKVGSITIESHESTNVTVVAIDFNFCFAIIITISYQVNKILIFSLLGNI